MNNTMTTYNTIELNVDETLVLVSYRTNNNGTVNVMGVQPVGDVTADDLAWVLNQLDIVERMIEKELDMEKLEPNFDEI